MAHYIAVNCGHGTCTDGSWDPGCAWGKYTEAALMLAITKHAVKDLRASGVKVLSDSDHGNNMNIIECVRLANKEHVEAYISIHCDYSLAVSGVMPLYVSSGGKKLAKALNTSIKKTMGLRSRGVVKRTDLHELNQTDAISCVLETGAIKADIATLRDKPVQYGAAIARGICAYLGVEYKPATKAQTTVTDTLIKISGTSLTVSQLKSLQKLLGVAQSGYIGGQDKALSMHFPGLYKVCKFDGGSGKSGTAKALQKMLGVMPDGVLGPTTIKAFQRWLNGKQTAYKLDIDGKFGDDSVKALVVYLSAKAVAKSTTTKAKPKTTTKTVKVTGTKLRRAKFLASLKKLSKEIIKHKFVYSNKNSKSTYSAALHSNKRVNCARYISWALQDAGLLPKGKVFWLDGRGIHGNGASYIKKSKYLKVTYPKKVPKKCSLIPGDICGFSGPHTQATANSKGTSWFSAGGSDMRAKKIYPRRKSGYDKKKVGVRIRIM